VRVRLAGICNTDIEILRGYHNFVGTLGHEFVGDVVGRATQETRTGSGGASSEKLISRAPAWGFAILARGSVQVLPPGNSNALRRRRVLGILGHDGAFAEFLALRS